MAQWVNCLWNNIFVNPLPLPLACEISGALHLVQPVLQQAGRQAGRQNVTGPEKTGLIYTKYTRSYFGAYLFFCVCYLISVSCIEFLRILCIYDEICVEMLCCHIEILHLKD